MSSKNDLGAIKANKTTRITTKKKEKATHLHLAVLLPQDRLQQLAALHCRFVSKPRSCQKKENRKAGQSQEGKVCTIGTLSVRLSLYNLGTLLLQET